MTSIDRTRLSDLTQQMLDRVCHWLTQYSPDFLNTIIYKPTYDESDDYEIEVAIRVEPKKLEQACFTLTLLSDNQTEGWRWGKPSGGQQHLFFGLEIENWGRIARRGNWKIGAHSDSRMVAGFEPRPGTEEQILKVCQAIAQGEFRTSVYVLGKRILCTTGELPSLGDELKPFPMPSGFLLFRSLARLGLLRLNTVNYERWQGTKRGRS